MGFAEFEVESKCNLDHFNSLNQGAGRRKDNSGLGALVSLQKLRGSDLENSLPWMYVVSIDDEWDMGNNGVQVPAGQMEGNNQNSLLRFATPVTVRLG